MANKLEAMERWW